MVKSRLYKPKGGKSKASLRRSLKKTTHPARKAVVKAALVNRSRTNRAVRLDRSRLANEKLVRASKINRKTVTTEDNPLQGYTYGRSKSSSGAKKRSSSSRRRSSTRSSIFAAMSRRKPGCRFK